VEDFGDGLQATGNRREEKKAKWDRSGIHVEVWEEGLDESFTPSH
jgi:hypothetical protein